MSVFQKIEELINENRLEDALLLLNKEIENDKNNDKRKCKARNRWCFSSFFK